MSGNAKLFIGSEFIGDIESFELSVSASPRFDEAVRHSPVSIECEMEFDDVPYDLLLSIHPWWLIDDPGEWGDGHLQQKPLVKLNEWRVGEILGLN